MFNYSFEQLLNGYQMSITLDVVQGSRCCVRSLRSGVWFPGVVCDCLCPGGYIRVSIDGKKQMVFHIENFAVPL